ncbi:MAG: arginase family protein [Desulfobacula sp.]|nr:arginase family protein [Desulfobacula sp.]
MIISFAFTFMRTPLVTHLDNLEITLVGVPYDGAVEARAGARQGPRQIRDMSSMMRAIHHVTRIDPAFAPGTGTPEVGGLTTIEAQGLIRGLRGLNLVGADLVEVAPPFDPSGNTALIGATMMYEILCILAERVTLHGI